MSSAATREREARRRSMLPGGMRDTIITFAKWGLPAASGVLLAVLIALPLFSNQEFSFLLSKNNAEKSGVRMKMQEATYRGETNRGEPFEIMAESGVQKTSAVPVVALTGLSAAIRRDDGPATVTAPSGEFFIDQNRLIVNGPVVARSASGFSLDGNNIEVNLETNRVDTTEPVSGALPMGTFRADKFSADLKGRTITMQGGVKLRLQPGKTR